MAAPIILINDQYPLPTWRYSRLTLMSSKLAECGDIHCWYVETQQWFELHGININVLPPLQYSLDCPHLNMNKMEKDRMIRAGIIKLETN